MLHYTVNKLQSCNEDMMIIHNIFTSAGSRKYPAHCIKGHWKLQQGGGGLKGQNFILESCLRNLSTVNFYTCTMYIHFSAVLTVSESVTQVLGICKNNVHMI